jgi:hypothetical protein
VNDAVEEMRKGLAWDRSADDGSVNLDHRPNIDWDVVMELVIGRCKDSNCI